MSALNLDVSTSYSLLLQNIASASKLSSEFISINLCSKVTNKAINTALAPVVGVGSYLLTLEDGKIKRRMLAIFSIENQWKIFDGRQCLKLDDVSLEWKSHWSILGGFGIASLSVSTPSEHYVIKYFRPWLRFWSEDMWTLNEIDIGWLISSYAHDPEARLRLATALQMPT
jgi:hypothetical protein